MKLIMRADDLGFSEGINYGILKSVKDGKITSVGMMPNMPMAKHGYELIKDYHICLGQHTNICVGKPVSDPSLIPSLVNEFGEFCSSKEIRSRKEDTILLKECEIEVEAQLHKFIEITGRKPDYFEGHAVMSKNFFQALKNIAKKYDLFYCDPVNKEWNKEYGITCAKFYQLDEKGLYDPYAYVLNDEADIQKNECSVLVFHPGYLDQYILDHFSYTLIRPMETEFLCSQRLDEWILNNSIQLVSFNDYKEGISNERFRK